MIGGMKAGFKCLSKRPHCHHSPGPSFPQVIKPSSFPSYGLASTAKTMTTPTLPDNNMDSDEGASASGKQGQAQQPKIDPTTDHIILLQSLVAEIQALNANLRAFNGSCITTQFPNQADSLGCLQREQLAKQGSVTNGDTMEQFYNHDPFAEPSYQRDLEVLESIPTPEFLVSIRHDLEQAIASCGCDWKIELHPTRPWTARIVQPCETSRAHWTFRDATLVVPQAPGATETLNITLHSDQAISPEKAEICAQFIRANWPRAVTRSHWSDVRKLLDIEEACPFWHIAGVDLPFVGVYYLHVPRTTSNPVFHEPEAHFRPGLEDWWPLRFSMSKANQEHIPARGEMVNTGQVWYVDSLLY